MCRTWMPLAAATLLAMAGCKDPVTATDSDDGGGMVAVCEGPTEVACEDALFLDLALHDDKVAAGAVTTVTDGEDFVTTIDATAGGFGNSAENPYVYLRFANSGAEKIEIDDGAALGSMEWHLAAKRFILRLNGGSSGPSCVGSSPLLSSSYEELVAVPDGVRFVEDDYYTGDCTVINDSSGLPNSPQVSLGSWWDYPGCVATSLHPFLVQLDDGRVLKLVVEAYYEEGQEACNADGTPGNNSARIRVRWRFLD